MKLNDPIPPLSRSSLVLWLLTLALLLAACSASSDGDDAVSTESVNPAPSTIAEPAERDVSELYESFGNPNADTVIVFAQGGPITENLIDDVRGLTDGLDLEQALVVNAHQAQTLDPDTYTDSDIDFEQAKAADRESIEMLAEVVAHFTAQGRSVHVVGISFGAFVVQDLIANHGTDASGYYIAVGRLDMPPDVWEEFAEGRTAGFVDGVDVVPVPIEDAGMGAGTPAGDRNMARLAAGLGHNRYTELLADEDLSKILYFYGETDEQVGSLTQAEIQFLESRGAVVVSDPGGHDAPVDLYIAGRLGELTNLGSGPGGAQSSDPSSTTLVDEIRVAAQVGDDFIASVGIDPDTRFRIGSVTKTFTAVVVVQLAAEGLIDLDAPVTDYIETASNATVREILTHRAGITDDPTGAAFTEAWLNQDQPVDPASMTDEAIYTDTADMHYSNTGYLLAGDIIEAVTGEHEAVAIAQRITGPLEMSNTCWPGVDSGCDVDLVGVVSPSVFGGSGDDVVMTSYTSADTLSDSAGALISTSEDLTVFIAAVASGELDGLEELVASTADPALTQTEADDFYGLLQSYGLGVMVFEDGRVGHGGQTFGFQSLATHNPATGESIVVLVNDSGIDINSLAEVIESTGSVPSAQDLATLRD